MSKPTPRRPRVYLTHDHHRESFIDVQDKLGHAREFDLTDDVAALESFIEKADIWLAEGPMPEINAKRVRARLLDSKGNLGSWEERQPGAQVPEGERRYLIPELWPWGTTPLLTGQPKVGKSTLVAELVASLAIPGRRFLDHFDPASLSEDEMHAGGITIISAEGAPEDYERELIRLGVDPEAGPEQALVTMYHLEAEQLSFDLTDPEVFEEWLIRLAICDTCDGTDDLIPTVIVVDGITAVLQNAGMSVEQYGAWIAAFRMLQRALGTPNGLVVGHSTFGGGHALGNTEGSAQSDGLWGYTSSNPDKPTATRKFKVTPRMGGIAIPPTRVDLEDGRLALASRIEKSESRESSTDAVQGWESRDLGALLVEFVAEHHARSGKWPTTSELRGSKVPRKRLPEVREKLVEEGRLHTSKLPSNGGGAVFMIPDSEIALDPDLESDSPS